MPSPACSFPAHGRETTRRLLGARSLAYLALPDACPACFRIQLALKNEMPYSFPLPGLLLHVDSFVKTAVRVSLDTRGRLPEWMAQLGLPDLEDVRGYVPELSYRWFRRHDFGSGLTVCGVPDDILVLPGGRLHIIDYKAARLSRGQQALLPLYEAQLNIYAYIARRLHGGHLPGPPVRLTLLYLEANGDLADADWQADRLALPFEARAVPVEVRDDAWVRALLKSAADILRHEESHALRHRKGCRELERMDQLMEVQTGSPFVAYWGRYHYGTCRLCGEKKTLMPDVPFCATCLQQEW